MSDCKCDKSCGCCERRKKLEESIDQITPNNTATITATIESLSELFKLVEDISNQKNINLNRGRRGLLSFIRQVLLQTKPEEISLEQIKALQNTLNLVDSNIDMSLSEALDIMDELSEKWKGGLKELTRAIAHPTFF